MAGQTARIPSYAEIQQVHARNAPARRGVVERTGKIAAVTTCLVTAAGTTYRAAREGSWLEPILVAIPFLCAGGYFAYLGGKVVMEKVVRECVAVVDQMSSAPRHERPTEIEWRRLQRYLDPATLAEFNR